jgi:hypothetical protein
MKVSALYRSLLLGAAVLLVTSAFAAEKGPLHVSDPLSINGKTLTAGDYNVKWEGSGANVELTILKGKEVVATSPARLIELDRAVESNATVSVKNSDGSRSLSQIQFRGKKYALEVGDGAMQASTQ